MLTAREMESFAKATSELIREATAPLLARIETLEATTIRDGKDGSDGQDGVSVTVDDVLPALEAKLLELVEEFPKPQDGKDGESITLADIEPLIESRASKWELDFERRAVGRLETAIARIPTPKDGKDGEVRQEQVSKAVAEYISAHPIQTPKDGRDGADGVDGRDGAPGVDGKPGLDGKNGVDGKSIAVEDVLPMVMERVQKALEAIPAPKDGRDGKDGADGLDGKDGANGINGEDGSPGIHGKDGAPGRDGKDGSSVTIDQIKSVIDSYSAEWALDFEKRAHDILQRTIDRMPKPKDGKDGRDALDIEDFELSLGEDLRTFKFALIRGTTRVERFVKLPTPLYREVWKNVEQYDAGDCVTFDGSMWVALKSNKDSRPGEYNKDWRLAVKRGRNGRDVKEPEPEPTA